MPSSKSSLLVTVDVHFACVKNALSFSFRPVASGETRPVSMSRCPRQRGLFS